MDDVYAEIAVKIIEHQESIIGPVAVEQAEQVEGLVVDWAKHEASVQGEGRTIIDKLVGQYKALFGQISVEVCKDAASALISKLPPEQLPESLK